MLKSTIISTITQAIEAIKPFTSGLQILGEYLKGKSIME